MKLAPEVNVIKILQLFTVVPTSSGVKETMVNNLSIVNLTLGTNVINQLK